MKILLLLLLLLSFSQEPTITLTPSTENFPNPERGFYYQDTAMWLDTNRTPLYEEDLRPMREDGVSVVRLYFVMDEYREIPLPDEALTYIEDQFITVRESGFKIIPRFAYNFPTSGEFPFTEPDATLELILQHIDQLEPILRRHADVIAFMEIGFVGAWGEWHSSTHDLVGEYAINESSREIITHLLDALPEDRMLAIRYAGFKQQLFGDDPLDEAQAFDQSPQARIGAHNDCFLASDTDWGTYSENPAERDALKHYLHLDNRFVPQGGETCNDDEEAEPFIGCENALEQLAYLRYSVLNATYHEGVLEQWQDEGCYDEIAQRLGYRFRLTQISIPQTFAKGGTFEAALTFINDGFASPYNPRGFEIILREQSSGKLYRLDVSNQFDVRLWLPDNGEFTLDIRAGLPIDIASGSYDLLLNFPDPSPTLYGNPEYSIQLANDDVWESSTGFNRLPIHIEITDEIATASDVTLFFSAE